MNADYCACGRRSEARCTACGAIVCAAHGASAPLDPKVGWTVGGPVVCLDCERKLLHARRSAEEESIASDPDPWRRRARALADSRWEQAPFDGWKARGVPFASTTPEGELLALFHARPLDIRTESTTTVIVRVSGLFGARNVVKHFRNDLSIPLSVTTGDGYAGPSARLRPRGELVAPLPRTNFIDAWVAMGPGERPDTEIERSLKGVGMSRSRARTTFQRFEADIERPKPLPDSAYPAFAGVMLSAWRHHHQIG
ncbi:hypothetical protein [Phycicoccus duodecadis]|uniref:hypothetical protein n=1 Tax=Phycicoccus duodecadis TaxID=173053 RepID=UPI00117DC5D4|nr:hypothetical protein [Phycicoccus duodecadis]